MLIEPHDSERHGLTPPNSCLVLHNAKKRRLLLAWFSKKGHFLIIKELNCLFFTDSGE